MRRCAMPPFAVAAAGFIVPADGPARPGRPAALPGTFRARDSGGQCVARTAVTKPVPDALAMGRP